VDISALLLELRDERNRLDNAISALEGLRVKSKRGPGRRTTAYLTVATKRRHMSAASRKRLSAMMKQRWAEKKKKASG
jgi:hypothetical protein